MNSCSAHTHEIARYATSRLLDQFTPIRGGLAAIHPASWDANAWEYRESREYAYA
jgi:hypothetical protein